MAGDTRRDDPAQADGSRGVVPDAATTDWGRIISEAGLGGDELDYLVCHKLQHVPQCAVADALGWTQARAERTRKRIDRHLRQLRSQGVPLPIRREAQFDGGSSLRPFFHERLASGHLVWSLSRSKQTMCPQLPIYRGSTLKITSRGKFKLMATTTKDIDLHGNLAAARARLPELVSARDALRDSVRDLEAVLDRTEQSAKEEAETALIENRPENTKILAAVGPARKELETARTRLATAAGAVSRQEGVIDQIAAEIKARRWADFEAEVRKPKQKLDEALEALLRTSTEFQEVVSRYSDVSENFFFFGPADKDGSFEIERALANQLVQRAVGLATARDRWGRDRGRTWKAA